MAILEQVNALETYRFFMPSFAIYGSVAGFYDFGPNGCKVKQNITQYWRQHYVLEENMLEVRRCIAPEAIQIQAMLAAWLYQSQGHSCSVSWHLPLPAGATCHSHTSVVISLVSHPATCSELCAARPTTCNCETG